MFISKDPIEFESGDFNHYRYVGNDPVNYVDPSGLESCECKAISHNTSTTGFSKSTKNRINKLNPKIQTPVKEFLNDVKKQLDINLIITQGYRSIAEQNALYAKGRTAPGKRVTNAKGGSSYHNYGVAIDVVEMENGKLNWNTDWKKIGEIGVCHGFEWGGNWKTILDRPHFQMTFGKSISDLRNGAKP